MENKYFLCVIEEMDRLWFQQIILCSKPSAKPAPKPEKEKHVLITESLSSLSSIFSLSPLPDVGSDTSTNESLSSEKQASSESIPDEVLPELQTAHTNLPTLAHLHPLRRDQTALHQCRSKSGAMKKCLEIGKGVESTVGERRTSQREILGWATCARMHPRRELTQTRTDAPIYSSQLTTSIKTAPHTAPNSAHRILQTARRTTETTMRKVAREMKRRGG
ncbi:hypothetical protein PIB30_070976 [Stylosanthes scabra]|uniref:Uncharacterized protein n=1 Tax=Stylosanthes scabra TaxID=79078 RepID=A0ABU6ZMD1_9FABA|nr:hypothetical protein [Stylosanthes scabra]